MNGHRVPAECHQDRQTDDCNPRLAAPERRHGSIELVEVIEPPRPGKLVRGIAYGLAFTAIAALYIAFVWLALHAIICRGGV
ncbi:MAG TPA: hypothetical protein VHI13_16690 [Candidatus Kapabacteria bacterium]|nr:hypothetical protein [Candidatus Kapabacteria bacterium]